MGENAEALRDIYASLTAGELDAVFARAADDFTLDFTRSVGLAPTVCRGRAECERFYRGFRDVFDEMTWIVEEVAEPAEGVAVVDIGFRARGAGSGIETTARGGHLWLFEGERATEWQLHQDFGAALLAASRVVRARRLTATRLYFVCEARPNGGDPHALLEAAIRGGAGIIQLRDKTLDDEELVAAARPFREAADAGGVLFILNDRPHLVTATRADGVHVGQDDMPVARARELAGPDAVVGLSTHSEAQVTAACAAQGEDRPDQISVGPVWETPTKAGRPATGLGLIEFAAAKATVPWFAIGGIDAHTAGEVAAAGATRAVVVRAIRDAADPETAAREIADALAAAERQTPVHDG
jgi:thiamine-phosphate pyrophosphorylase